MALEIDAGTVSETPIKRQTRAIKAGLIVPLDDHGRLIDPTMPNEVGVENKPLIYYPVRMSNGTIYKPKNSITYEVPHLFVQAGIHTKEYVELTGSIHTDIIQGLTQALAAMSNKYDLRGILILGRLTNVHGLNFIVKGTEANRARMKKRQVRMKNRRTYRNRDINALVYKVAPGSDGRAAYYDLNSLANLIKSGTIGPRGLEPILMGLTQFDLASESASMEELKQIKNELGVVILRRINPLQAW